MDFERIKIGGRLRLVARLKDNSGHSCSACEPSVFDPNKDAHTVATEVLEAKRPKEPEPEIDPDIDYLINGGWCI